MRVALIGPVPPSLGGATAGGVATHHVHLAAGLHAAGIDARLLATNVSVPDAHWPASPGEAPFPLYRQPSNWPRMRDLSRADGTRLGRYALRLPRQPGYGSRREVLRNLFWYHRFVSTVEPQVIHVQHPLERALYARLVRRFEQWRIPLVVTAHSLFGEHELSTIDRLMAPNLRAADRVIAVSDHVAAQATELGVTAERISVIRSGVDADLLKPRDRGAARRAIGIPESTPLVLFVGNLEPRKQVDVLLRAMHQVSEALPGVQLVIVGTGDSAGVHDQTARLECLARELGLSQAWASGPGPVMEAERATVQFVGRISDEDLRDYYAAADVFALPSSSEAQGIVALEAMACGLVVVASAVGGLLRTIEDGRTGYLVAAGDVAMLAERLRKVLEDDEQRCRVGRAARLAVERDFSWQRSVHDTIAVYDEIVTSA